MCCEGVCMCACACEGVRVCACACVCECVCASVCVHMPSNSPLSSSPEQQVVLRPLENVMHDSCDSFPHCISGNPPTG